MNAQALLTQLHVDGGFTVDPARPDVPAPATGYMVSLPGKEQRLAIDELTASDLVNYAATLPASVYFGAWIHDGHVYLDASVNIPDLDTALRLGREWGQLAIWDCQAAAEITIGAGAR